MDQLKAKILRHDGIARETRPENLWSRQVGPRGYSGATGLLPFPHMLSGLHVSDSDIAQCEQTGSPPDWMCRKYAPAYAKLHIVGLQKAGTSQLYRILVHHAQVQAATSVKEMCPTSKEYSGTRKWARYNSLWPAHNMSTKGVWPGGRVRVETLVFDAYDVSLTSRVLYVRIACAHSFCHAPTAVPQMESPYGKWTMPMPPNT